MKRIELYTKLLRQINNEPEKYTDKTWPELERTALEELIKEEYLTGTIAASGDIYRIEPTLRGHIFQDALDQKLYERTFKYRILKQVPLYIAFVLGVLTNIITFFFLQR